MSISASGLFMATYLDVFDASQEPIALVGDTIKLALFTNSITSPNFSTNTSYASAPYTSNEIPNATGYTTGGVTLATKTFTELNTAYATFDADDAAWTSSTFSGARGGLIWDDTPTTPVADPVLGLINFGADYAVTSGTFTVQFAATGIFRVQLY